VAALAFDSEVEPVFLGLRAATAHVRRLLFQVQDCEVDLAMTPSPAEGLVRLDGQVTAAGVDPADGYLRLSRAKFERQVKLENGGEFWMEGLTPGAYRLEVLLSDRVIEVPALPL
jgi:hypothetical protein